MKINRLLLAVISCVLFALPAKALENIKVGTTTRTMLLYTPKNLGQKRPLVISCHGASQDANYQSAQAHFENIADTAKFLVVFPNGIGNSWDISGNSDIEFITTIIDTMVLRYNIDRNRVYLSGFSMGGMLTYFAMTKIADKIAAFAPISGYPLGGSSFTSSRPVPIIHTHGTGDDVVTYSGVAACLAGWVKRNNCPTTGIVTSPYPANRPTSVCKKTYWGVGDEGSEVVLMELAGKGHWISNDSINGIFTSDEIWRFCRRFSLNLVNPVVKLTAPTNGSTYTTFDPAGTVEKIVLTATASDPDGTVASVAFYDGTTLLTTVTSAPFIYEMTNVPAGTHTIKALVTDNEGKTGQTTMTFKVVAAQTSITVSSDFTAGGLLPAGWKTFDGTDTRTAPLSGLSSGCRILQMTGSPRDFDFGLYFRNTTGGKNTGNVAYGLAGTGAELVLTPGVYELKYMFANWNNAAFTELTAQVESINGMVLTNRTTRPVNNIGNSVSNGFSGTKTSSLWFSVAQGGTYALRFITADLSMADAILTNIVLSKVDSDPMAVSKSGLCKALGDAKTALKAASDTLYAGIQFNQLNNLFQLYNEWSASQTGEYDAAAQALKDATDALLTYKMNKDATETNVLVFKDNFNVFGGNVLPKGWRTYDSSTQRKGGPTQLASGCRILQFSGATRDFDYGLYIRNIAGTANMGFAKYAALNCDTSMTLTPGKYKFSYRVCNWNMSNFGSIIGRIANRADSSIVVSQTVTPTTNIGNSVANNFSGSTLVELNFSLSTTSSVALEFYTANAGWGDAIISDITLNKIVYVGTKVPVTSKNIRQIRYYNMSGMEISRPGKGLVIQRTLYDDGTSSVSKSYFK